MAHKVQWKFDDYLKKHGLTAARVEREIIKQGYQWGAKTIYRFTGEGPKNLNRDSLEAILTGLERLTGHPVHISDLLEVEHDALNAAQELSGEALGRKPSWRDLIGLFEDPDSPGDISARMDDYLNESMLREYEESTRGER
ncbi:MAG: hypothetical protein KGZ35_01400 [Truepera sp.]|nr:hypothetical protein [Truepera sp.]